jgi:chromosome segregation ATPase
MRNKAPGVLAGIVTLMVLAGCQQPEEAPNEKVARLLAAQNAELRQETMARLAENQALQHKHAIELQRRDEELAKCKARIAELQKDLEEGIAERVRSVTTAVMDENAKLRKEVETLRAEITRLKTEVERQRAERERLKAEMERLQPPTEAEPQENP